MQHQINQTPLFFNSSNTRFNYNSKLPHRTHKELGKSTTKKEIPERVAMLDFLTLKSFDVDTPCVGVFFFLPYLLESAILDIVKRCQLPSSFDINAVSACLSMLLLKLMGCHRLSHTGRYQELGLGVFAGVSILLNEFVTYWKGIQGNVDGTLVFNCRFSAYESAE